MRPTDADIDKVAKLILSSKFPIISALTVGPNRAAFDALAELANLLAIPVMEGPGMFFGNFAKSSDLYLGSDSKAVIQQCDLMLFGGKRRAVVSAEQLSQGPADRRHRRQPLKGHMVYQTSVRNITSRETSQ